MIPDAATTSTPAPQAPAPANSASASSAASSPASGSHPAPASPAPQPTPVQLLWEVATLAFDLMRRLVHVLRPIQQYYPKQALLLARLLIDIPRILLTIRYAPERVTLAQLRHLTRARHILQALFNYTLPSALGTPISRLASAAPVSQSPSASTENATPLGPRTSSSANPSVNQHPSASTQNATPLGARTPSSATTPSPAVAAVPAVPAIREVPAVREVPEVPLVSGISSPKTPSAASAHTPVSSPGIPQSAIGNLQSAIPGNLQSKGEDPVGLRDHNPHSSFSPYIPDFHTLAQALKSDTLPPNCAGALFEEPGDALVKALHQLYTIYFSLYPNQYPSPVQSPSPSNPQSTIYHPQSGNPQSDAPSVNPVNTVNQVNPVNSVHSPSPAQSEIPNPQSAIYNPQSDIPHSTSPP